MREHHFVYIVTNRPYGTLYVGYTSDLAQRMTQHQRRVVEGFTARHGLDILVWYEMHHELLDALERERRIKKWHRDWKVNLIQARNPGWQDLSGDL